MKFKVCSKCEEKFFDVEKYFSKNKRSKDGFQAWCKMCNKKYKKKHYRSNKKQILEEKRKYYEKEKDKILDRRNKYRQSESGKAVRKKYYESEKCRESMRKGNKKYLQTEKGIKMRKAVSKRHYENNKLSKNMSVAIRESLRGNKEGRHWESLVDYTLEQLKTHLEDLFQPGMSWNNYGLYGWHIDHKIPISVFNITSYICEDFKKCWALENLQPLWAEDNLRKSNKMEEKECF